MEIGFKGDGKKKETKNERKKRRREGEPTQILSHFWLPLRGGQLGRLMRILNHVQLKRLPAVT